MSSPDSSGGMSHSAVRPALFDAYRGVNYDKPRLRGWAHLISFELALVIGTLVIAHASGALHVTAAAIYAGAVVALFGTSALYHRGTWGPVASARLQKLDHLMIIYLIAGTATPVIVICLHGTAMVVELTVLWTIALLTAFVRILRMNAPEGVVGALYIGLGWSAGLAIPAVWVHAGVAPALLLIIGGLLYTAGAVVYGVKRPNPAPRWFGFHEVFHTLTIAAFSLHFIGVSMAAM